MTSPALGTLLSDEQAMRLAIEEARRGAGFVSPNPQVGAVVLDSQNRLLSKGYHQKYGGPHAEVNALQGLSPEQLKGARIFVTLEPCAHEGKTPSCAKMIAKLPVKEVVYGLVDPNPLVAGQGADIVRGAGIQARLFLDSVTPEQRAQWEADLEEVCEHFLMNFRRQLPFVSLKVASSLDGQMGLKNGESKWITGAEAREHGHYLRATHDAILVGKNTVLLDDPKLDVRHPRFPGKLNKLVILDTQGECLKNSKLQIFAHHKPENIFVVTGNVKTQTSLAQTISMNRNSSEFLHQLLTKLWGSGVKSVLVEGGAQVLSSFISQEQAHRLYLFQASVLLGASSGKAWSEGVNIGSMSGRIPLKQPRTQGMGPDLLITGRLF
jgi:diaminohydroxyphosphoribosylaminopyrimidine deaminase/5-amino-6-(5-phosphoribosylamino)uracil reductase